MIEKFQKSRKLQFFSISTNLIKASTAFHARFLLKLIDWHSPKKSESTSQVPPPCILFLSMSLHWEIFFVFFPFQIQTEFAFFQLSSRPIIRKKNFFISLLCKIWTEFDDKEEVEDEASVWRGALCLIFSLFYFYFILLNF